MLCWKWICFKRKLYRNRITKRGQLWPLDFLYWHRRQDSNPYPQFWTLLPRFWRPVCYRYTTPMYEVWLFIKLSYKFICAFTLTLLLLSSISFWSSLFIFVFSFKRYSTFIVTFLNRVVFINSIFFSFIELL